MRLPFALIIAVGVTAFYALLLQRLGVFDDPAADTPIRAPILLPSLPLPIHVENPVPNYMHGVGRHMSGSCLHAAVQDLLRWRGMDAQADYWHAHFGGGATLGDVSAIADKLGLKHAQTDNGGEGFLDDCAGRRLGAAIYWEADSPGDHAIVFCGYEGPEAVLLGTNRPVVTRMDKAKFLAIWHACGGGAFTILPTEK
jgi:hypothetical protein